MPDVTLFKTDKDEFKQQISKELYTKAKQRIEQKKNDFASTLFVASQPKDVSSHDD